ncbi:MULTISPECIES: hypothetical protein [Brevibacterium]|uniref:DUF3995 domain-containing protein n=1 Tax=Brevibacterium aurantiacum TaxID=273384 RepID=A0A4Z0KPU8_BREAU|nr:MULTISPECIES: hypothetical protein [Brevibacterium]TGD40888.1 hypothetical protein EB834_02410 [Brevibacterium aurantiacum]
MKTTQSYTQSAYPSQSTQPLNLGVIMIGLSAVWSLTMLVVSVLWGSGLLLPPFGHAEPGEYNTLLDYLSIPAGAALVGSCALLSLTLAATLLTLPRLRGRAVAAAGIFAVFLTLVTTVVFTDTLVLAYLGYTLSLQFPPIPVAVLWQGFMLLGPGLWIAVWASLESRRRSSRAGADAAVVDASVADASTAGVISVDAAEGRQPVRVSAKIAVGVAVAVPVIYASTRILWALGIPFGLSPEFYSEGLQVGMWHSGLALAIAGLLGALLTLGLVQRWGERFPRWTGPLVGRRVPILLATIPAGIVTLAMFTGGMGMIHSVLLNGVSIDGNWVTIGPTLLFPLWALALGWATYAYRARRLDARAFRRQ